MAQDNKFGSIEIPGVGADEPVFIIRGQDTAAVEALYAYAECAADAGADSEFVTQVGERASEFFAWQEGHRDRVKVPD